MLFPMTWLGQADVKLPFWGRMCPKLLEVAPNLLANLPLSLLSALSSHGPFMPSQLLRVFSSDICRASKGDVGMAAGSKRKVFFAPVCDRPERKKLSFLGGGGLEKGQVASTQVRPE